MMVREALGITEETLPGDRPIYLAGLGEAARLANMKLAAELRRLDFQVIVEVEEKSLKAQLRTANRLSAVAAIIRGDTELEKGTALCRNLLTSEQAEVALTDIPGIVGKIFTER